MNLPKLLDPKKIKQDKNGIWITDLSLSNEIKSSRKTWENIYNFNLKKLKNDRIDFNKNKLNDHISYISKTFTFTPNTVYLEIGCGPSYIAEYLMKKHDCYFIGVDFNYQMLLVLKKYFKDLKYKKFILVHADINDLPLKNNSIDYIYGGGVIEHFKKPEIILKELLRVLKKNGVSFNTVPAFNFFWPVSMKKNIPSIPVLRQVSEFVHIKILNNKLLEKYHGYELSFGMNQLKKMHKTVGFKSSEAGAFAFHPSSSKLNNTLLRNLYFNFSKFPLTSPIFYIAAKK